MKRRIPKERQAVVTYLRLLARYTKQRNPFISPEVVEYLRGAAKAIQQGKHLPRKNEPFIRYGTTHLFSVRLLP